MNRPSETGRESRPSLEQLLRQLPREKAPPGLAGRALLAARLRPSSAPARRNAPRRFWGYAVALAAAAALGVVAAPSFERWFFEEPASPSRIAVAAQAPADALIAEYESVQRELEILRVLASERTPLLQLEGQEADYLVDPRDFLAVSWDGQRVPGTSAGELP